MSSPRRWATKDQAAQHIGVHINTIDRWRNQGRITTYQVGGVIRFDLDQIDAILAASGGEHGNE